MANKRNMNYQDYQAKISFIGDTSALQKTLSDLREQLQKITTMKININSEELKSGVAAAKELQKHLYNAMDPKTGNLDLSRFNNSLRQANTNVNEVSAKLLKLGSSGQQAFVSLATAIGQSQRPLRQTNELLSEMWATMKNTVRWQITSSALHGFMSALSTCVGYAKDLNRSLTDIRIVSGQSGEQMAEFAVQANEAAKELSVSTTDYTDAALIYYQQGLPEAEVQARTNATVKLASVTGESAEDVSSYLTAIWNNFREGSESVELFADKLTALGASTATSTDEIAAGLSKFSSIAQTIGLSYDYATSAIAAIVAQTRESPEVVGTALKSIFSRIEGLKLGETLEDGTDLNKYSEALQVVGVNIKDQNGELKNMDVLIDEIGQKWGTISKDQQIALAETVAGVRQYNQFVALFDNYDVFKQDLGIVSDAEGELQKQADIYAEGWAAASNRVKAAMQSIYQDVLNDEAIIDVLNAIEKLISALDNTIDGFGGIYNIMIMIASFAGGKFYKQISAGFGNFVQNLRNDLGLAQKDMSATQQAMADQVGNLMNRGNFSGYNIQLESAQRLLLTQKNLQENFKNLTVAEQNYAMAVMKTVQAEEQKIQVQAEELQKNEQKLAMLMKEAEDSYVASKVASARQSGSTPRGSLQEGEEARKSFQRQMKTVQEYAQEIANLNMRKKEWISGDTDINRALEGTEQNVVEVRKAMVDYISSLSENEKVAKHFEPVLEGVQAANSIEDLRNEFAGIVPAIDDATAELKEFEMQLNHPMSEGVRKMTEDIKKLANETAASKAELEKSRDTARRLGEALEGSGNAPTKMSERLFQAAMAFGDEVSIIMGLKSIVTTFTDMLEGNVEASEGVLSIMMSLTMLIPSLISGYESLSTAVAGTTLLTKFQNLGFVKTATTSIAAATGISVQTAATLGLGAAIGLVMGGIYLLTKAFDYFNISAEEASEKIDNVISNYDNENSELENLNSQLEDVKNQIDEIESKGSLTLTDQGDLQRLKQEEAYLKNQVALQEHLVDLAAQKVVDQMESEKSGFKKAASKYLSGANVEETTKTTGAVGGVGGKVSKESADAAYKRRLKRYREEEEATSKHALSLKKINELYEEEKEAAREYAAENSENLKKLTDQYQSYIEAIQSGRVEYDEETFKENLATMSSAIRGSFATDTEYFKVMIAPVLDETASAETQNQIYDWVAENKDTLSEMTDEEIISELKNAGVSNVEEIVETAQAAGISLQDFFNGIANNIDIVLGKFDEDLQEKIKGLSAEDFAIFLTLNLKGTESWDKIKEEIEKAKNSEINVTVKTDEAQLESINSYQKPLEDAITNYNKNGALTADEARELIEANSEYAIYLKRVGDQYVLTQQALDDYRYSQKLEAQETDELIEKYKQLNGGLQDNADSYAKYFDAISKQDFLKGQDLGKLNTGEFSNMMTDLENLSTSFYNGKIDLDEYLTDINEYINQVGNSFSLLQEEIANGKENIADTDALEAAYAGIAKATADAVYSVAKQFNEGSISIEKYGKTLSKTFRNSIDLYGKVQKNVEKTGKKWVLTNKDIATSSEEAAVDQLNHWERQLKLLDSVVPIMEDIQSNYDLLEDFNVDGEIVLTDNFDLESKRFQSFMGSLTNHIAALYDTNRKAYNAIIADMAAAGADFQANVRYSGQELLAAAVSDANIASATINGAMIESQIVVTNASQAVGVVLSALGNAISNFDYTLTISTTMDSIGFVDIEGWLKGERSVPFRIPDFTVGIKGSGPSGDIIGGALKAAGSFFTDSGTGSGRSGFNAYNPSRGGGGGGAPRNNSTGSRTGKGGGGGKGKGGKGKGGGGGSGSEKEKEVKEELDSDEEIERYHYLKKNIEDLTAAIDKYQKAKDRAYGRKHLEYLNKEIDTTEKLVAEQKKYTDEIEKQNEIDKKNLAKYKPTFDSYGNIVNYQEMYQAQIDKYNAAVKKFNQDQNEDTFEVAEKEYENFKNLLETFETNNDLLQEEKEKLQDQIYELLDKQLEKIEYRVEVKIDVEQDSLDFLEYKLKKLEDRTYSLAEQNKNLIDQYQHVAEQGMASRYGALEILQMFKKDGELTDKMVEDLREYKDTMLESNETLLELHKTVEESFLEGLEEINDALDENIDRFDTYNSMLEHYQAITELSGKAAKEFGLSLRIADGASENALNKISGAKSKYDTAIYAQQAIEAEYQAALAFGDEEIIETKKEQFKQATILAEEAKDELLQTWEDALDMASERFELAVEQTIATLEDALSPLRTLDEFQDQYDKAKTLRDQFLNDSEKLYELNKLNRDIENSIDSTDNLEAQEKLRDLAKEILEIKQEDKDMSQYDLEYLQQRYQLLLAEAALKEAENAKNTLRLARDASGNWNYMYTADQSQIDDSAQKYEDELRRLEELSEDYIDDLSDQIIQNEIELSEALAEIDRNQYENEMDYYQALKDTAEYYYERDKYLRNEMAKAMDNLGVTYDEITFGQIERLGDLDNAHQNLVDNTEVAMDDMSEAWRVWYINVEEAARNAGVDFDDFNDTVDRNVDNILNQSQSLVKEIENDSIQFRKYIDDILQSIRNWEAEYVGKIRNMILANEEFIQSINETIAAQANQDYDASVDYSAKMNNYILNEGGKTTDLYYQMLESQREAKRLGENMDKSQYGLATEEMTEMLKKLNNGEITQEEYLKWFAEMQSKYFKYVGSFASGGYTGDWAGDEGRIALVHKRETIFNAEDTEAILTMSNMIKTVASSIRASVNAFGGISTPTVTQEHFGTTPVQQQVQIDATFPGVTEAMEIQTAFNNLINDTIQYIGTKKS